MSCNGAILGAVTGSKRQSDPQKMTETTDLGAGESFASNILHVYCLQRLLNNSASDMAAILCDIFQCAHGCR